MSAFCTAEDVRKTLQERSLSGPTDAPLIEASIEAVSEWFARSTNGQWYDSGASSLIDDAPASAADVRLSIPSSPHRQDRQVFRSETGVRYPVTTNGRYARLRLPHRYVEEITRLAVRQRDGSVVDWTSDPEFNQGRGEDYYFTRRGQDSYGLAYLFVQASSVGARTDFGGVLTLDYDYGLDAQTESWDDVRRGIAALVAADVLDDDGLLTQLPDNARLVGVETEYDNLLSMADRLLQPYLSRSL